MIKEGVLIEPTWNIQYISGDLGINSKTPNRILTRRLPDTKCINASPRIRLHAKPFKTPHILWEIYLSDVKYSIYSIKIIFTRYEIYNLPNVKYTIYPMWNIQSILCEI